MYEISVERTFAAAHALRGYKGKCERVHGHNYRVRVTLAGERLNTAGLLVDFVDLKRILRETVDSLDHEFLNEVPPFDELNPTAENMARYFHDEIWERLENLATEVPVRIKKVKIWETGTATATYRPE